MPLRDCTPALTPALVERLKADGAVATLVEDRIFADTPKAGTKTPCIAVGEVIAKAWDDDGQDGADILVSLNVWAAGMKAREVADAGAAAVVAALDGCEDVLAVAGAQVVGVTHDNSRSDRFDDRAVAIVTFRVLTSAT